MRIFIPFALIVLFIGWAAYRFFIKKDLKAHYNELGVGCFFIGVWAIIYSFMFNI